MSDGNGRGVSLVYSGNLLSSLSDPQGRSHSLAYTSVLDETGVLRKKLTSVTVQGPGSPNRVSHLWRFVYRDATDPNLGYGGSYTGDNVIRKTAPDGTITDYSYSAVNLGAGQDTRPTANDWDGKISAITWSDSSTGTTVTNTITRSAITASLTFTGGREMLYTFSGRDLTAVTEVAAGADRTKDRTWTYEYDSQHNLTKAWSPLEPVSTTPLIQYDYTVDPTTQQITQVKRWVRGGRRDRRHGAGGSGDDELQRLQPPDSSSRRGAGREREREPEHALPIRRRRRTAELDPDHKGRGNLDRGSDEALL